MHIHEMHRDAQGTWAAFRMLAVRRFLLPEASKPIPAQPINMVEFLNDPYPLYKELQKAGPIQFLGIGIGFQAAFSHALISSLLRDTRFSAKRGVSLLLSIPEDHRDRFMPLVQMLNQWLLLMDPPEHTRLRKLMNKEFSPAATERLRSQIEQLADEMIESVDSADEIDFMSTFAHPFPAWVIARLLGVPPEMNEQLILWSDAMATMLANPQRTLAQCDAAQDAFIQLTDLFRRSVQERRGKPGNDLISLLLEIEADGAFLTEEELLAQCVMLIFAGHETTRYHLGSALYTLLRYPEQLEKLRADPSLIRSAVEELLRFESPVQFTGRMALEDLVIEQTKISKGQTVLLMFGAANRDPAQFSHPDDLDITRGNNEHLAFGAGIHFCLGNQIARLEAQSFILKFLKRYPKVRLTTKAPEWQTNAAFRGLKSFPVLLR